MLKKINININYYKLGRIVTIVVLVGLFLTNIFLYMNIRNVLSSKQQTVSLPATKIDEGAVMLGKNVLKYALNIDPTNEKANTTRIQYLTKNVAEQYQDAYVTMPNTKQEVKSISLLTTEVVETELVRCSYQISYDVDGKREQVIMSVLVQTGQYNYKVVSYPAIQSKGVMTTFHDDTLKESMASTTDKKQYESYVNVFFQKYFSTDQQTLDIMTEGITISNTNYTFEKVKSLRINDVMQQMQVSIVVQEASSGQQITLTYMLYYKQNNQQIIVYDMR